MPCVGSVMQDLLALSVSLDAGPTVAYKVFCFFLTT